MKLTIAGLSVAALLAAGPAFAQDNAGDMPANAPAAQTKDNATEPMKGTEAAASPKAQGDVSDKRPEAVPVDMKTDTGTSGDEAKYEKSDTTADLTNQPHAMRASKLIGTTVYNKTNDNIGDVNEIVIGPSGSIANVVIGVGGFLGLGERNVAVNFKDLTFERKDGNLVLHVKLTKEELTSMPAWVFPKS